MKLIEIKGKIWELTRVWSEPFGDYFKEHDCDKKPLSWRNERAIEGKACL